MPHDEQGEPTTMPHDECEPTTMPHNEGEPTMMPHDEGELTMMNDNDGEPTRMRHDEGEPTTMLHDECEPTTMPHDEGEPTTMPHKEVKLTTMPHDEGEPTTMRHDEVEPTTMPHDECGLTTIRDGNVFGVSPPDKTQGYAGGPAQNLLHSNTAVNGEVFVAAQDAASTPPPTAFTAAPPGCAPAAWRAVTRSFALEAHASVLRLWSTAAATVSTRALSPNTAVVVSGLVHVPAHA